MSVYNISKSRMSQTSVIDYIITYTRVSSVIYTVMITEQDHDMRDASLLLLIATETLIKYMFRDIRFYKAKCNVDKQLLIYWLNKSEKQGTAWLFCSFQGYQE